MAENDFRYDSAFQRNRGWFREEDQSRLRSKRIAIPGLGGVGGHHLHGFLRLGFEKFNLADPDVFEVQNFNRQQGASCETVGQMKIEVAAKFARSLNPGVDLKLFPQGVTEANMDEFLDGVDIVVDALDLFAMDIRIALYELAYRKGIPVVTAGPFGMGTAIMAFSPSGMSFNDYFDLKRDDLTVEAKIIRFLAGITPNLMHQSYLREPEAVDLFARRLPSLNIGCYAASAAIGSMVVETLLGSSMVRYAPRGFHVDFNRQKAIRFWRPWGNRNILQRLKIKAYHQFFHKREFTSKA